MTEPKTTVNKIAYHMPVTLLGLDEQGRQLYQCPNPGCGDTGYFDADGRGICPTEQASYTLLAATWERLQEALAKKTYFPPPSGA